MIKPCMNCHPDLKNECSRLAELRIKTKGLGLKSMTISCKAFIDYFPPGQRVIAKIYGSDENISGTVSKYHRYSGKFLIFLDEIPYVREYFEGIGYRNIEGHHIVKIKHRNLTKLDDPLVPVCSECNLPEGFENTDKWHCWKCNGEEPPV
jgi:hypothetical protein